MPLSNSETSGVSDLESFSDILKSYMTWPYLITLIVLFIILTWYFMKKYFGTNAGFYDTYDLYPSLKELSAVHAPENFYSIQEELSQADWFNWPEKNLWNQPGDDWKVCALYGFGRWHPKNVDKFPKTVELLKQIPGLRTAIFSRLGPNTRLQPHHGWASLANEVLRSHMGIVVPKDGRSGVEVEGEFKQVKHGDWFTFDDSKEHIGVNETKEDRIVLLIDINRPWWVRWGRSTVGNTQELNKFLKQMELTLDSVSEES